MTAIAESLKYWVILPTYCEAENLPVVFEKLTFPKLYLNILVVDDNSPDGTAEIAIKAGRLRPDIHLLQRPAKTGLGAAYLDGFRYAIERGADAIITMDSDLSHDPASIPALISGIDDADCVVGSRYVRGGKIVNWPIHRRALSFAANRFVKLLFSLPVRDSTSGFRVYRRNVIEDILKSQPRSQGYSFQVEALTIAVSGALSVKELPICFVERVSGRSKMGMSEVIQGIWVLTSLWADPTDTVKSKKINENDESGLYHS